MIYNLYKKYNRQLDNLFDEIANFYDLLYEDKDTINEVAYINKLINRFSKNVNSILELGSGTGRHGIALSEFGYEIYGIEKSRKMVEASKKNVKFSIHEGDIRDFRLSKKFDLLIVIFSPILEIKLIKFSFTKEPFNIFELLSSSKLPFEIKFSSETSLQKLIKSLFLATKSVSLFISIIDTLPFSSLARTKPSDAVLLIFLEAFAIPFFLKNSTDFSKSPFVSSKAILQSLKPTPVSSLSFFILSN